LQVRRCSIPGEGRSFYNKTVIVIVKVKLKLLLVAIVKLIALII